MRRATVKPELYDANPVDLIEFINALFALPLTGRLGALALCRNHCQDLELATVLQIRDALGGYNGQLDDAIADYLEAHATPTLNSPTPEA
jgi:hypothetical protein